MPQYIKHIDNETNDDDFSRGYPVDLDQFDTIYSEGTDKAIVGNSLRDYIKVHIYDYSRVKIYSVQHLLKLHQLMILKTIISPITTRKHAVVQ